MLCMEASHHTEISMSQIMYSSKFNHVLYLICGVSFISITYTLLGVALFMLSVVYIINSILQSYIHKNSMMISMLS
jgi:hypothetical protein